MIVVNTPAETRSELDERAQPIGVAFAAAVTIVLVVALGLRIGTGVLHMPATFDEPWITVPINDLIVQGWSRKTAIDFDETKGPGLIWPYAVAGKWLGGTLNDLRLFSMMMFIAAAIPLLDIARRAGVRGGRLCIVALFYALLPYHAPLSQLVMSEPSFVALSIGACWLFVSSFDSPSRAWRIVATTLFIVTLSVLLHNRVHAAALGAGVTFAAFQRGGFRMALPWAVASFFAGLSRIPLLMYWGGIVSPRFQGLHSLGVEPQGWTYLLATFALPLSIMIPIALMQLKGTCRMMPLIGAGVGIALAVLASPDMSRTVISAGVTQRMYAGIAATLIRTVSADPLTQSVIVGMLATFGAAGLASLIALCHSTEVGSVRGLVDRLQAWTLLAGIVMSAASAAPQYDRYPLAWMMLMPIIWAMHLPRWAILLQGAALLAVFGWLSRTWLH